MILIVHKEVIQKTVKFFNSINVIIQFTMELEEKNRLSLLDLLVIKESNIIITDLYNKPTNSSKVLNFQSSCPLSHKMSIIEILKQRILKLSQRNSIPVIFEKLKQY